MFIYWRSGRQGSARQISFAYSAIVRSLENCRKQQCSERFARPRFLVGIQLSQPRVRVAVALQVRQVQVVITGGASVSSIGANTPGSCWLNWLPEMRSSAARVSGSFS